MSDQPTRDPSPNQRDLRQDAWVGHDKATRTNTVQGDTIDTRGSQGYVNRPTGPVSQTFIAPPPIVPSQSLHQLRPPVSDFVGRAQEINDLVKAISTTLESGTTAAISGLRGMGGIGKTELAYAVVQRLTPVLPDAQLVVELRGASEDWLSPEQALQKLIHDFEPLAQLPDNAADLQTRYRSLLSGKRVLVLADDARDAEQIERLAPPAGCALLVTSRRRFLLPGMQPFDLGTLREPEATTLVLAICPRIGADAVHLVTLCGRLPLALRLSASLLANDPTRAVGRHLTQLEGEPTRLRALQDPDMPHRGIAASLQLSYAALDPPAQAALAQLSVFAASFDGPVAAAVVQLPSGTADTDTHDLLSLLYRRSLVDFDPERERYSLHDLVRVFAHQQLRAAGTEAEAAVRLRHATWYAQVAQQADTWYAQGGPEGSTGLALFDAEHAHIDAAWDWLLRQQPPAMATDVLLLRYADGTANAGDLRYHARQRIPQFTSALDASRRLCRRKGEGAALGNLGSAYRRLGEVRQAIDY